MSVQIEESGVLFGDFETQDLFQIEKSSAVANLGDGISKVEFIYYQRQGKRIIFLEAKKSYPRDAGDFFEKVRKKMLHSLTIWITSVIGRHNDIKQEMGSNLQERASLSGRIYFYLVVPDMPSEHCAIASLKFRDLLDVECRLWDIRDVDIQVLNMEKTKKLGLISQNFKKIRSRPYFRGGLQFD